MGRVRIGGEQGGPARTQGAVGVEFDRSGDDAAVGDAARSLSDQGACAVGGDAVVDADRRLARLGHPLQHRHVAPGRAHEMQAGPAIGGLDPEAGAIGGALGRRVLLRHQAGDELFGGVDQQAGGRAVGLAMDLAAEGGLGLGGDPGGFQRRGGDGDGMTVGPTQQDDAARGGGVQVMTIQEPALGPVGLDPAAPDDGTVRMRLGPGLQPVHGLGGRGRAFQVQRQFAPADAVQVGVAVGEAGEQGRALQVDGRRRRIDGRLVRLRPDPGDAPVAHQNGLGGGRAVDARVDRPAPDQQVLRRRRSGDQQGQGGQGGGGPHCGLPTTASTDPVVTGWYSGRASA